MFPNTKFRPKIKILKFGTKIALIGYFGLEFQKTNVVYENNCCHICNQRPPIFLIAKFREKIAISKFGTKNVLFGCFGQQF